MYQVLSFSGDELSLNALLQQMQAEDGSTIIEVKKITINEYYITYKTSLSFWSNLFS